MVVAASFDLEKHIELVRLASANEELTTKIRTLYVIFLAELHAAVGLTPVKQWHSDVRRMGLGTKVNEIQSKRKEIIEQSSTVGLVDSVDSFLDAAEQISIDCQARITAEE
jgi:hypothetical protein